MASILDQCAIEVINRVKMGQSFQAISDWLGRVGISITRQSVHSWYSRRMKKIHKRARETSSESEATPRTVACVNPPGGRQLSAKHNSRKTLQQFIEEGESHLGTADGFGSGYIVKPKQGPAHNPVNIPNMFAGLSIGARK